MEHYLVTKKDGLLSMLPWMNLGNVRGAEGPSQITHQRCHFHEMSRKCKATETESRLVVAGAAGVGGAS